MKKTIKNILLVLMLLVTVSLFINNGVLAYTYKFNELDGKGQQTGGIISATENVMGTIISVIRIVGTGIAIIMLTYVAIKYMSGAPSEKAEFKKSAVAYIVGAIVLVATTNILNIIANFATNNIK